MKHLFTSILFFTLLVSGKFVFAQPCASVNVSLVTGTLNQPCDTNQIVNFTVNADVNTNFSVLETDTYSLAQIPYTPLPWTAANTFTITSDDVWSTVYNIPFKFCFFGVSYDQFIIGSNGQIGFDLQWAGGGNPWASASFVPIAAPTNQPSALNNTIFGAYHDIDYNVGGTCTWDIIGTAPCRKLVINWTSVPMFSCNQLLDSQQVVLYEFTNIIDMNIANKPLCANWNSGLCHQGIQNANATIAYTTPGRNGTQWTANNDSWRYSPAGNAYTFTKDYTWINGATMAIIGTGQNLSLTSPYPPYVICQARIIGGCNNDTTYAQDTLFMLPGKVSADFSLVPKLGCDNDTVVFTNNSIPTALGGTTFIWQFGDGNFSGSANPTHVYQNQGVYNITLIANNPNCESDTAFATVDLNHPIDAIAAAPLLQICYLDDSIRLTTALSQPVTPGVLTHFVDWGDGTTYGPGAPLINTAHIYLPGKYTIKLIITDTLGCTDSAFLNVEIEEPAYSDIEATPLQVCEGEPIYFTDSVAAHSLFYTYNYGDNNIDSNTHNPMYSYQKSGNYIVRLTSFYAICPPKTDSVIVDVFPFPNVNLGPDTAFCPDITQPITLSDINNQSGLHLWSNGENAPTITVNQPGKYWASSTVDGCSASDSIQVFRDCYLNIPNSFTPDGDGLNDYFLPRELLSAGLVKFTMNIFDRWGVLIYSTNAITGLGWDGLYNDTKQPMGVYIYSIDAEFKNKVKRTFTGNVTLLR